MTETMPGSLVVPADPYPYAFDIASTALIVIDMQPHDQEEYRGQMGHVWLGFSEPQIGRLLAGAGFSGTRVVPLPPTPGVRGPALFAARAIHKASSFRGIVR